MAVTQPCIWQKRLRILTSDIPDGLSGWMKVGFSITAGTEEKEEHLSLPESCPVVLAVAWKCLGAFWDATSSGRFCSRRLVKPTVSISRSLLEKVPSFGRKYQPRSSIFILSSLYFPSEEIFNSWYKQLFFFFHEMSNVRYSLWYHWELEALGCREICWFLSGYFSCCWQIRCYFLCSWSIFKPSFEQTTVTFFSNTGFLSDIAWDSFIKMPCIQNKLLFRFRIYQHQKFWFMKMKDPARV